MRAQTICDLLTTYVLNISSFTHSLTHVCTHSLSQLSTDYLLVEGLLAGRGADPGVSVRPVSVLVIPELAS